MKSHIQRNIFRKNGNYFYYFIQIIYWYTFVILGIVIISDIISFINMFSKSDFITYLFFLLLILAEIVFIIATIWLINYQFSKYAFYIILIFWTAQILFFGIRGNVYSFTSGIELALYIRFNPHFDLGTFFNFWSKEFRIELNAKSQREYFGINILPLILSISLVFLRKKLKKEYYLPNKQL